jgi:hypothetical protein
MFAVQTRPIQSRVDDYSTTIEIAAGIKELQLDEPSAGRTSMNEPFSMNIKWKIA